jgi:hypothetical protein
MDATLVVGAVRRDPSVAEGFKGEGIISPLALPFEPKGRDGIPRNARMILPLEAFGGDL